MNRHVLKAYGDREGDGMVQMSFTLAIHPGDRAREAAKRFAEAHGLSEPLVSAMEQIGKEHTYFVVYGRSSHTVDVAQILVEELRAHPLTREQVEVMAKRLGRKIVVVGACTGSDAHTVG
ncbi:MAG TPA: OAM dimerization domain-containing protein, partial [Polyangiaceae bacterium]|nr:OAM dimerization domain-containing protein [Polyangiaceae bacterium]